MVELKPFDIRNARKHFEWNNDEELNYYDSDFPHKVESFDSFINRVNLVLDKRNAGNELLEIHLKSDNRLIGIVDIHNIDRYNLHCQIDCSIGESNFRNKGYGTAAMHKAIDYCFNELDMHKVSTTSFDFNKKWITVVKKMGFRHEGTLRHHTRKNGVYCDKLIFGLLQSEYAGSNGFNYSKSSESLVS